MEAIQNKKKIQTPQKPTKKKQDPQLDQKIKNYSIMIEQWVELAKKTSATLTAVKEMQVEPWHPAPKLIE